MELSAQISGVMTGRASVASYANVSSWPRISLTRHLEIIVLGQPLTLGFGTEFVFVLALATLRKAGPKP